MKTIQVFDKPMCCSTGVCGPQVDPVLPRFAADLDWLKVRDIRWNALTWPISRLPSRRIETFVKSLEAQGTDCLPLIVVDGQIVSHGHYPSRDLLGMWTGAESTPSLPVVQAENNCCGGSSCC